MGHLQPPHGPFAAHVLQWSQLYCKSDQVGTWPLMFDTHVCADSEMWNAQFVHPWLLHWFMFALPFACLLSVACHVLGFVLVWCSLVGGMVSFSGFPFNRSFCPSVLPPCLSLPSFPNFLLSYLPFFVHSFLPYFLFLCPVLFSFPVFLFIFFLSFLFVLAFFFVSFFILVSC